jgi:two-component system response regulator RegX3
MQLSDTRTLDTHVKRLRQKIEGDPTQPRHLVTIRGVGFRLDG